MGKVKLKTVKTTKSVAEFIAAIKDPQVRADCKAIDAMMRRATGEKPAMWGTSIIGYGDYHYKYKSGAEGDWTVTAFSPRKQNLTIYIMTGFSRFAPLLKKLGPHKTSVSCLYIKRLSDVDTKVLEKIIKTSVELIQSGKVKIGH